MLLLLNQKGDIQLTEDLIDPTEMLLKKKKKKAETESGEWNNTVLCAKRWRTW